MSRAHSCTLWFTRTPAVRAQFGGDDCIKAFLDYNGTPCFTCCPPPQPQAQNIIEQVDDASKGTHSASLQSVNCGGGSCNGGGCGNPTYYYEDMPDPSCCLPSGTKPCQGDAKCCSGLICLSSNTCGACINNGQSCKSPYDCCSGLCSGSGQCVKCLANGQYCSQDSDCCSGSCDSDFVCTKCPPGCDPVGNACSCCPIVLDTTGAGFKLTDIEHGAYFRWAPNGPRYAMSWTDPAGRNGWLALPDKNGKVEDATDLFSSPTPQPKTGHPNGFIALAVYDLLSAGGNNNGWIDPGDSIYSKLRVWIDENQDGEAQPEELHTLDELGVERIGLRYHLAEKVDRYGNVFRYVSQALDESDPKVYDVWMKLDPDATKQ